MNKMSAMCVVSGLLGALVALTGCETKSADEVSIAVTPDSAQLRNGESQEFRASGAASYRWNLSSSDYGVLSGNTGDRVVYTSRSSVATTVVLSVQGTLVSSGVSGGTNSSTQVQQDATVLEGLASIVHVGDEPVSVNASPRSATLAIGDSQEFKASGGTGSYEWSLSSDSLGWLTRTSGPVTTYTATGTNATQFLSLKSGDETLKIPIYGE